MRGPAKAPPIIRRALWSASSNAAAENGLELGKDIAIADHGDLALAENDGDDGLIDAAIAAALTADQCPISLGGDHSVSYPIVRALHRFTGPVTILHFDAHPDLYDAFDGNRRSHASPFARIMEEQFASRLVQVGIRTLNAEQRAQAQRFGVEIIPARGFDSRIVPLLEGPLYVSIDLDGLDPAFAPGVSHHEPGGLTVRELIDTLHLQRASLAGADVVELNPDRDIHGMTAMVAAKLVKELCAYAVAH